MSIDAGTSKQKMRRCLKLCTILACATPIVGCDADSRPEDSACALPGGALVLATTTDAPPYAYVDGTGKFCGIDIDIARAAAAKLGRKLEIRAVNAEALIPLVKSGKADMAASGLSITAGRLLSVDFSIPYAEDGGAFLYRAGERMPTMTLAESMRVATVESMSHDFYLTRHGVDPVRYRSLEAAVKDVESGKVDALYDDKSSLVMAAKQSNGRLATTPRVTREQFGIAVCKGQRELKAALDAVIGERAAR